MKGLGSDWRANNNSAELAPLFEFLASFPKTLHNKEKK